ncbi:retron St85 family effector protein [Bacillus cereus]|uniref:retron St85 family effector protein n=1 Tax=Bacillus cereus TaxID=1396 RepID=UPI00211D6250|nr:retron St85 family effector protein [Bacillus cereus]
MPKHYIKNKSQFYNQIGTQVLNLATPHITKTISEELNIFLIGADVKNKKSMRYKLQNSLKSSANIYLPEDIFEEEMFQKEQNLLSLENILADSVDAIVMCIESPGSFTELGAFSNHKELSQKLIVCPDLKYKRAKSFINLGPIKYLKQKTKSEIFYLDYSKDLSNKDLTTLIKYIKKIKKNNGISNYDISNPIFAERYVLALLYVLDNINRLNITDIIKTINNNSNEKEKIISIVYSALSTLSQKRELNFNFNDKSYSLSNKGKERLKNEYTQSFIHQNLDSLRIKVLNFQLRRINKHA